MLPGRLPGHPDLLTFMQYQSLLNVFEKYRQFIFCFGHRQFLNCFADRTLLHIAWICISLCCIIHLKNTFLQRNHLEAGLTGSVLSLQSVSNLLVTPVNHILHSGRPKTLPLTSSIPGLTAWLPPTTAGSIGAFGRDQDFILP